MLRIIQKTLGEEKINNQTLRVRGWRELEIREKAETIKKMKGEGHSRFITGDKAILDHTF